MDRVARRRRRPTPDERRGRWFFDVDGKWAVEGEGVAPDIEVRNDPKPAIAGRDPQLERAIDEALRLVETEAITLKPEPPPPVRYRRPVRR